MPSIGCVKRRGISRSLTDMRRRLLAWGEALRKRSKGAALAVVISVALALIEDRTRWPTLANEWINKIAWPWLADFLRWLLGDVLQGLPIIGLTVATILAYTWFDSRREVIRTPATMVAQGDSMQARGVVSPPSSQPATATSPPGLEEHNPARPAAHSGAKRGVGESLIAPPGLRA